LDSAERLWLGNVLMKQAAKSKSKEDFIFDFTAEEYRKELARVSMKLGLKGGPPLSAEARWGGRRSQFRASGSPGCQGPREVADRFKPPSIHQGRQDPAVAEPVVKRRNGVLSLVTSKPRKSSDGANPAQAPLNDGWTDVFHAESLPRRFSLEIFAGTSRVTSSCRDRGIHMFPIDIGLFPSHNVLDRDVEHRIFNWVRAGRVQFIWIGMPSTTFSRARKWDGLGPGPLRTDSCLFGLPNLRPSDAKKVREGNALLNFCIRLLQLCQLHTVPYVLENPHSSMAWIMPSMERFISRYSPDLLALDCCQFGEPWKKPTRLLCNFIDLSSVALRCKTVNNLCSKSFRPHIHLAGLDGGIFRTLRAQPYPWRLTEAISVLVAQTLKVKGGGTG
jgi:hypothetical protein